MKPSDKRKSSAARQTLLFALALFGCGEADRLSPVPKAITPSRVLENAAVEVTITGENFSARVFTDFDDPAASRTEPMFAAMLGNVSLRQVRLERDGSLTATVPEGMAPGIHDLTVTDPWHRAGVLPAAMRVLSVDELPDLVATYRWESIGPQRVGAPFSVSLTAIDDRGAVVEHFNTEVILSDLTGTALPVTLGHFVEGQLTAVVEIRTAHPADVLTVQDARGRNGSSNPFLVSAREPAALRFITAPQSLLADTCSAPVVVALLDQAGFKLPAPVTTEVTMTSSSPELGFYSDEGCTVLTATPRIGQNSDELIFHFRSTRAGKIRIGAEAQGLEGDSQLETVLPSTRTRIAFATLPQNAVAGECSATVTVEARNPGGVFPYLSSDVSVTLASSSLSFFSDSSCTQSVDSLLLPSTSPTASFYFSGTLAGPQSLSADVADWLGATQVEQIDPAAPEYLAFTTPPRVTPAGECSPTLTVGAEDRFGNPSPLALPTPVELRADPSEGFELFSDPTCATEVTSVSIPAGSSSADFQFLGTRAGEVTLIAFSLGLTSTSQEEIIQAMVAERLLFTTPVRRVAAGACSQVLSVQSQDGLGNPVAVPAGTSLVLTAEPLEGSSFFADGSCAVPLVSPSFNGGDTFSFYVRGTQAGSVEVSAAVVTATGAQEVMVTPSMTAKLTWDPLSTPQHRDLPIQVTLKARDAYGNVTPSFTGAAALSVIPSGPLQCLSPCSDASTTDSFIDGVWTGTLSLGEAGAGRRLTAVSGGVSGTSNVFEVAALP
jgi:hypothetical protein